MQRHPSTVFPLSSRTAWAAQLLCASLAAGAALPQAVQAQPGAAQPAAAQTLRSYAIPAGPLGPALNRLGRESGTLISFTPEMVVGLQTPGAQGPLSLAQAMAALLAGTPLRPMAAADGSYQLQRLPEATWGTALQEVQVVASAERDATTEGTGAYASNAPSATSTRLPLAWQETPQSLSIITRQRMDDQRLDTLDSAVETATGITAFRQSMGSDLSAGLMSRGFSVSNYEVDGIPTIASSHLGQSTAPYDRVEIVRGATGLMSGLGTPGATINLMRKRPTVEPQRSVSVDLGSWGRRGASVDLSGPLNDSASVRGRIVVDARNAHSWVDRYRSATRSFYGIVEADLTDATLVTAGLSHERRDNTAPLRTGFPLFYSDGSPTALPRSYNSSPTWTYYNTRSRNAFVSLEHRLANGWRGKLEFNQRRFDFDGVVSYLSGDIDPVTGLGGVIQPAHWNGAPEESTLDGYATGHFPLFGRRHELVAGFTVSRLKEKDAPSYGWFLGPWTGYDGRIGDLRTWDGSARLPQFTQESRSDSEVRQQAVYATARFHLSDTLSLVTGARLTDWKDDRSTRPVDGEASRTVQQEKSILTPYAGLVYRFNDRWSAYGSYTQIFKPQGYGTVDVSGRRLDPEEGSSIEAGLKGSLFDDRLQASAAVFQTRLDNSAIRDESFQDTLFFIAQKGLKSRGLELELAGEPLRGWNLSAGYAFTDTQDASGARAATQIPRHSVKLFSTYRLAGALQGLTLGAGLNWQSANGYTGYHQQASYALVSLMARYDIDRHLSATLNIGNLLDRSYYTGTGSSALYGPPRHAVASLTYRF